MRAISALLLLALLCTSADAATFRQQVDGWRTRHEKAIVGQLDALVRVPSVAANPRGLADTAVLLEGLLKARGFRTAQWSEAGAPPLVYGSLAAPGAKRTVVFYAHYDGQPVTASQWRSDPFTPVMRAGPDAKDAIDWQAAATLDPEWRLFGRAAADDKSSIAAFLAGFDALKALGKKPSVNIKVVWEGEEEHGSPHLTDTLKAHETELAADLWFIGDAPVHQSRTPTLYFGARGGAGVEATVYGPIRALHDGHYGNWVPNPASMAAHLITSLRDDDGHILIPGFYDDVTPLTPAERAAIARLPPVEDELKKEFQIGRSEGSEGLTASTMRPAMNIKGIRVGAVGPGAAGAIPTEAVVDISFRLVPGESGAHVRDMTEAYLTQQGWTVVHDDPDAATRTSHARIVKLKWGLGYPGFRTDMTGPAAMAASKAEEIAAGRPPVLLPMMGAGVPIYLFDSLFHKPVIGLPIANHDDDQHAPNENLRLQNLWDGVAVYAAMMAELRW